MDHYKQTNIILGVVQQKNTKVTENQKWKKKISFGLENIWSIDLRFLKIIH